MFWYNPPPAPADHPPHPMRHLLHRIEAVWLPLLAAVATALHPLRHVAPLAPRITLALRRLQRAHDRIATLLSQLASGTWRAPRRRIAAPPTRKRAPAPYLPRRRAWLGHVTDYQVRTHASQLAHLLNDPGTRHLLSRAPPLARAAIARTLRGPARLLGIDLPSMLQFAGPPRPPKPRALSPRRRRGAPEGGVLPTDRPIPRNVLAYARYNRRRYGKGA